MTDEQIKKLFLVLGISRLMLYEAGIPLEQVKSLSDEDMTKIADRLNISASINFFEDARFVTRLYLEEKKWKEEQKPDTTNETE